MSSLSHFSLASALQWLWNYEYLTLWSSQGKPLTDLLPSSILIKKKMKKHLSFYLH